MSDYKIRYFKCQTSDTTQMPLIISRTITASLEHTRNTNINETTAMLKY